MYVDLPRFDFPVVFSETVRLSPLPLLTDTETSMQEYPLPVFASLTPSRSVVLPPNLTIPSNTVSPLGDVSLCAILDPEIARENPVEAKHRRLVRSHRNGPLDRELKPNAKIRDDLNVSPFVSPLSPLLTNMI